MSVFTGESIQVATADNLSGSAVATWEDIAYRAGSSTFTAGDVVTMAGDLSSSILVAPDTTDVTVSWAIVVLSGSGAFSGSESGDIAGGGPLGSVSVSGAGTYLLPSTVTVADILANGDADLELTCSSGTIVVQQVKLRVWPTGGVVGGWSSSYQPDDVRRASLAWSGMGFLSSPPSFSASDSGEQVNFDQQAITRAEIAADTLGPDVSVDTSTPLIAVFSQGSTEYLDNPFPGDTTSIADAGYNYVSAAYLHHPGPLVGAFFDPPGTFGTDWTYPPDEVWNDPDVWDVTGTDAWDWWQGRATLRLAEGIDDPAVSGNLHLAVSNVADVDDPGAPWSSICTAPTISVNAPGGTPWIDFDLPPATATDYVRFVAWHDGAFTEQPIAFTVPFGGDPHGANYDTGNSRASLAPGIADPTSEPGFDVTLPNRIAYRYTPAPFRYWVPSVARVIPLRQFHRDDGLGVTPPRAYGGSSRTRTGRAYGYT